MCGGDESNAPLVYRENKQPAFRKSTVFYPVGNNDSPSPTDESLLNSIAISTKTARANRGFNLVPANSCQLPKQDSTASVRVAAIGILNDRLAHVS